MIILAVAAFRNATTPEQEIDRALSATLETLGSGTSSAGFAKILSLPFQLLSACKEGIMYVCMLPFRFVSGSIKTVGSASNAMMEAVSSALAWIFGLPANLAKSLINVVGNGLKSLSNGLSDRSRRAMEALSASFLGIFAREILAFVSSVAEVLNSGFSSMHLAVTHTTIVLQTASQHTIQLMSEIIAKCVVWTTLASNAVSGGIMELGKMGSKLSKGAADGAASLNQLGGATIAFWNRIISRFLSILSGRSAAGSHGP